MCILSLTPLTALNVRRMDQHIHVAFFLKTIATLSFILLITLPQSHSQQVQDQISEYTECSKPFNCGQLSNISYPFWGERRPRYCGGGSGDQFKLNCDGQNSSIQISSRNFTVLKINTSASTMRLVQADIRAHDVCSASFNITMETLYQYTQNVQNVTIFKDCPSGVSIGGNNFTCQNDVFQRGITVNYFMVVNETTFQQYPLLEKCGSRIQLPTLLGVPLDSHDALKQALEGGFEVKYTNRDPQQCLLCRENLGECGTDDTTNLFSCYCPDGSPHSQQCALHKSTLNWSRKLGLGMGSMLITGLFVCTICCCRGKLSTCQKNFWLATKSDQDIEAFLRSHGDLALKRYKFSDVKKITNSFKVKLGQGGFGVVYQGKLLSGCPVAVKILNESKGNGEEFINEVASISRTSHVNVVTLFGFCFEGRKKVLIYEFMANGSLEKFIFKRGHETTPSLSWENLYQIALGIARGLEYLHRGCNTRILHFDIKPHNILLDENFCPKISDFGLAKLCFRKESIISMSDARGTIGYVAPEVWNRHFGGVSHKSDVYSFGMLLLDMVGERNNTNANASNSSDIYFPQWIYKRLEEGTHLGLDGVVAVEENEITKRMTVVGLWCIQPLPNDRPTMSRVIDMLEGNMNYLEMPPKPTMASPTRPILESSTSSTT